MPGMTLERNDSVVVNRCTCVCLSVKKDRMCILTVLGAFEIIIALASFGMGNWAVISYAEHLRKTAAFNFWSGGAVITTGILCLRACKHINKRWITTTAIVSFLTTLMYMSSGCWMIKLLIDETDKNRTAKAYIFYGFNTTSSIVGFLLAGLSAAVAWSVREQLPTRTNVSGNQASNQVGPTTVTSFSVEDFRRSMSEIQGPPPPYEP